MAVKSIKLVVPPGYFCQLLFSPVWETSWIFSVPSSFMSSAAWNPQISSHFPNAEITCAVKRHLHLNHNWRKAVIIQSSLWFIGSIVWINEYFCCVGVYITALLCASADEMVREGRKWAHSLGYSPFFFFFAKLQSFSFGARQPLLCCQAAECFAESWAAWQGYVEAKLISLLNYSQKLPP